MTGVAEVEDIKDGLVTLRHLPPKHSTSFARVACVARIT